MSTFTSIRGRNNSPINSVNSIIITGPTNSVSGNIIFSDTEFGPPTKTTKSIGTRLVLNPTLSSSLFDTAFGMDTSSSWFTTPSNFNIYSSSVTLIGGNNAVNSTTGQLIVQGGAGFSQDVYIGGNLIVTGTITNPVSITITTSNLVNITSPTVTISKQTEAIIYFLINATCTNSNTLSKLSLAFNTIPVVTNIIFTGQVYSNGIGNFNLVGIGNTGTNKLDITFTSYLSGTYTVQGIVCY